MMERRYSDCKHGRIGKYGRIRNFILDESTQKKYRSDKKVMKSYSHLQMAQRIVSKRLRIPRTHSKAGTSRKERKSQRRISRRIGKSLNRQNLRMTLKPVPTSRWLHLSSSQWTPSSTPCAERRNISYSTEIHWCDPIHVHRFGRHARKAYWRLLEYRFKQKLDRTDGKVSQNLHYWKKNLLRDICGPGGDWQKFKRLQDQITCGLRCGPK